MSSLLCKLRHFYFVSISNSTQEYNKSTDLDFDAGDDISFDCFAVNNTDEFKIDCDGVLTNITFLTVKRYWLNITLNDTLNNLNTTIIYINTTFPLDTTLPSITLNEPVNNTNQSLVNETNQTTN